MFRVLLATSVGVVLAGCAGAAVRPADSGGVEVALTVDDLPAHGPLGPGLTRVGLAERMARTFRAHQLPPVYGFVNAGTVEEDPSTLEVLQVWKASGQLLGNHSFAHANLDEVPLEVYLDGITRNEPLLSRLEPDARVWRMYRYPYLREGKDPAKRRATRAFLREHGYRIAEVSLDADDWTFNPPLARCLAQGDLAAQAKLREDFITAHVEELRRMRALGQRLEHREVRQVLLLHLGLADVDALEGLLTAFEQEGVRWISLDRALEDPFYAQDPELALAAGAAFPYVVARARGVKFEAPRFAAGLEERLERVCRP